VLNLPGRATEPVLYMITTEKSAPAHAPSMIQLGQRLLAVIALVTSVILAVWLWVSWDQTQSAQIARMANTVKLLAAHSDNYFTSVGRKLEIVANDLEEVNPLRNPRQATSLLRAAMSGIPDIHQITLARPDGLVLASTAADGQAMPNLHNDPERRVDFDMALKTTDLRIGRPHTPRLQPQWVIPLYYSVRDLGGRVQYVILAEILLEQQQTLWRKLDFTTDAALGLWREDGYLISRIPADLNNKVYGQQTMGGALNNAIQVQSGSGSYEGAVVDGSYRIGVYQKLGTQPLYAFLSLLRSTFVSLWWQQVRLPLALVAGFLATTFLAYWQLTARYSRRMRAIEGRFTQPGSLEVLPSSGVREIDTLVVALAQSREKLTLAAQFREKQMLAAVDAGTYAVRERDGVVVAADTAFLQMLDLNEPDVVGRPWGELLAVETGALEVQPEETLARRIVRVQVGTVPRWFSVAEYRDTLLDGERVRYGLAIDVSDRENLLSQVKSQSQRLQALWQLATTRDKSDAEKVQHMLRLALDTLQMNSALVHELHGSQLVVRNVADDLHLFHTGQAFALEDVLYRHVVENKCTLIIPDLRADPDLYRHPLSVEMGMRAFACVPIWAGQKLYGFMLFMRRIPLDKTFGADEQAYMELLAAWFGQVMLERQQHDELESMAMTDMLTKLINRRAAEGRFSEEIARARRAGTVFSIAICDLDRFKLVNDHYGHDTGDEVLRHVSQIMKAELRDGDWVARWGGEEFIIFLHLSDTKAAHVAMERLRLAIRGNPASTAHGPLDITTSIGIGTFLGNGDLATVLSEADGCLFEAKHAGRDQVVMRTSNRRDTLWKAGMLQHALLENRLVPAYQVMVDLRTNKVVADEALARLIEPDGRVLPAEEFIEAAEGINLIHIVDEVVARQSMQRCALNLVDGTNKPGFAHFINLSPQFLARRELVQAMLHQAAQHCADTGMADAPVRQMVLEITERQLIGNFEDLLGDLQPLLDFGFRLALDDFGSGYSSFLYLASLPVSFLKIEGWMVQNMRNNPKVLGMVKSIIALARDQGLTTIAECVEDAATAELLRDLGADWGQGWYFGRPECEIDPAQIIRIARTGT
jgi:diguanylate cyclase (GGDEF)-like protein